MNASNWTLWLAVTMLYCSLTNNPLYQLLLFCALSHVVISKRQPLKTYIKLGLMMSAIPLLINTFFVHFGKTTLYKIPYSLNIAGYKIPLIFIAGPITAEAIAFALIITVFLLNMLIAFQIFNAETTPDSILRLIPRQLPAVGLASSIAMRFIPTVVRAHASITDAQTSRGVRIGSGPFKSRLANQLGIIAPTVITTFERGINISESMASRGYTGKRTTYRVERWNPSERTLQQTYLTAAAVAAYAKYIGVLEFWPYDSTVLPPASIAAMLPIAIIAIPALLKDESSRA